MDLSSTFVCQNWKIRYGLYEPQNSGNSSSATKSTVVFVHGTPWSSVVFHSIAKALLASNRYRVLLYDLPGYGESQEYQGNSEDSKAGSKFAGDTSVKAQGVVLAELLAYLKLNGKVGRTSPAVIAHDIAGAIALRAHLIHHCEFSSLLLLDTNTVLPWGDGFYKLARSQPDVFLQLPSGIFEAVVRAVIQSACFNRKSLLSGWEDALAEPWIRTDDDDESSAEDKQRSFVRQIAQANDADVAEMLDADMYSHVRCDIKILWGEQDQWIPREKMDSLAEKLGLRLKEFVVVPEAGHLLMIDQPERVTFEIISWLT